MLTADLDQLTKIFVSTEEHATSDYWGWSFWDSVADGRAHFIDMHTKRNRLYCVRALQLLALLKPEAIGHVKLLGLGYLAVEGNPIGLPAMLQNINSQLEQWLRHPLPSGGRESQLASRTFEKSAYCRRPQ